jgi:hypothetical protein
VRVIEASGGSFLIDDEDYDAVSAYRWSVCKNKGKSYAVSSQVGSVHRFLLAVPDELEVDHKDGNGLNNQRHNLRPATRQQQCQNSKKRTRQKKSSYRSELKGVCRVATKRRVIWRAVVKPRGKRDLELGCYQTEREAGLAHDFYALKEYGEFAYLNFPQALVAEREKAVAAKIIRKAVYTGICLHKGTGKWYGRFYAPGPVYLGSTRYHETPEAAKEELERLKKAAGVLTRRKTHCD